MLSRLTSHIF